MAGVADGGWRMAGEGRSVAILVVVGLDPHRRRKRSPMDVAVVMGALAVILALVLWATLG
ncbi:MAG: hypothetical protein M5U19_13030 [Microthrixaceae bacterium]|nr:hypothetical protein [Microthrixaceae bacterium]